ncbi:cAMP dependent protein kinase [Hysterangium stoloniferum]|nr:cAMP dependent protein kinase [Hysterangium stoloniferum]
MEQLTINQIDQTFYPTPRRESVPMLVDAPMTPPTSPIPKEQQPTPVNTPITSSLSEPTSPAQQESLDQILRLQELQIDRGQNTDQTGQTAVLVGEEPIKVTKEHEAPQRSLEEEPNQLVSPSGVRLTDFDVVETLGTGTFGRVLLVKSRNSTSPLNPIKFFAMKVLRKSEVVRLRQVEHVNSERYILSRVRHPFIVDLYATFQDNLNIYMLLSYVPGGELFTHLRRAGRFTPDVTRFYLATIILALKFLHSYNIIYRDLKPENLLLDSRGYLRLTDFGFAKRVDDRTWTLCGTPEYLAPEIIQADGHGKAADWWACGILCYEMLVGYPPFFDDHAYGIYEKILRGRIRWPGDMDPLSREIVRAFLHPDRSKRLGNLIGGPEDVLNHPWFRGVDWEALERREIRAPIIPHVSASDDTRHFSDLPLPPARDIPGLVQGSLSVDSSPTEENPSYHLFRDF